MSIITEAESIIQAAKADFIAVENWFKKAQPKVVAGLSAVDKIVNIAKTFESGMGGATLTAVLEAFAPGLAKPAITALNEVFTAWGWVESETTKTPEQIAVDIITKAASLTGNAKIAALSTIAGLLAHVASGITLQQALSTVNIVHDPTVLGTVTAPTEQAVPNVTLVS